MTTPIPTGILEFKRQ